MLTCLGLKVLILGFLILCLVDRWTLPRNGQGIFSSTTSGPTRSIRLFGSLTNFGLSHDGRKKIGSDCGNPVSLLRLTVKSNQPLLCQKAHPAPRKAYASTQITE